jgi:hypothetical protein
VTEFKVAMLGPSRIGKTSIIAAILHESRQVLAGTPVRMRAANEPTEGRILEYDEKLTASLTDGTFQPASIEPTENPFVFKLKLEVTSARFGTPTAEWAILDYPGGWIDPRNTVGAPEARQMVLDHLHESNVLILPTDATAIMTAASEGRRGAATSLLEIVNVREAAREWANRRAVKRERGILILAPVKCEAYFNDNGGDEDLSARLQDEVRRQYESVLKAVAGEFFASDATKDLFQAEYVPIDTIGCVMLQSARWKVRDDDSGKYDFTARYTLRGNAEYRPRAAREVMGSICQMILSAQQNQRGTGFLSQFWDGITGQGAALSYAVQTFGSRPRSPRWRQVQFQ